jgi:hypothetical protein
MAFPWELNLDRPYRSAKWRFPEQRARGESTDSVFGGAAEKLDEFPAESKNRQPAPTSAGRVLAADDGYRFVPETRT